jgi:hypothetical protein
MSGINSSLTGTGSVSRHYRRVSPDAIPYVPFRDAEHVSATAETSSKLRQINVAVRILDGIVKNKYANNPGKLAAWLSASHVEKAPKKKEPPTP